MHRIVVAHKPIRVPSIPRFALARVPRNVVVVRVGVRVGTRDTLAAGQVHGSDGAERHNDPCAEGGVGAYEAARIGGAALGVTSLSYNVPTHARCLALACDVFDHGLGRGAHEGDRAAHSACAVGVAPNSIALAFALKGVVESINSTIEAIKVEGEN